MAAAAARFFMSIRETPIRSHNRKDYWPLEEIPEAEKMGAPMVKNTFAVDTPGAGDILSQLTPAQKQSLTEALLADSANQPQSFDLSKPPVKPYTVIVEYPKTLYSVMGSNMIVNDRKQEEAALKKGWLPKPPVKKVEPEAPEAA